jgi:ferritin-like metal-binding protein YciE
VRERVQDIEQGPALDAVIIGAMQKAEHYCIAAWGTAKSLAQAVGNKTATRAMDRALKEGKGVDEKLTQLAENDITPALLTEADDEEDAETPARSGKESSSGSGATT